MAKTRLFLAGDLPGGWLKSFRTAVPVLRGMTTRMSPAKTGNEHLTWVFLGELDERQVAAAEQTLSAAFASLRSEHGFSADSMDVTFDRWTAQVRGREGYLVRADLIPGEAHRFAVQQISNALAASGIPLPQRSWLAHVTLARRVRLKDGLGADAVRGLPQPLDGRTVSLERVTLYESAFTPNGMHYSERMSWK